MEYLQVCCSNSNILSTSDNHSGPEHNYVVLFTCFHLNSCGTCGSDGTHDHKNDWKYTSRSSYFRDNNNCGNRWVYSYSVSHICRCVEEINRFFKEFRITGWFDLQEKTAAQLQTP